MLWLKYGIVRGNSASNQSECSRVCKVLATMICPNSIDVFVDAVLRRRGGGIRYS